MTAMNIRKLRKEHPEWTWEKDPTPWAYRGVRGDLVVWVVHLARLGWLVTRRRYQGGDMLYTAWDGEVEQ